MSRVIAWAAAGSCVILAASWLPGLAADKSPKSDPAEANARKDVLAALKAEASGDNEKRKERLSAALATAPALAEANWHLAKVRTSDKWLTLDEAESEASSDPQVAEFR